MSKKKHNQRPKYQAHQQRQAGDAQRAKGRSKDVERIWDEVDKMRLDATATSMSALSINSLLNNHQMLRSLSPSALTAINTTVRELAEETKRLIGNLKQIGQAHADRSGRATNERDHARALVIFQQYVQWMEDWEKTIYPVIEKITDTIAEDNNLEIKVNPNHQQPGQQFVEVVEKSAGRGESSVIQHIDENGYTALNEAGVTVPHGTIGHTSDAGDAAQSLINAGALAADENDPPTASQIGLMNHRDTTE